MPLLDLFDHLMDQSYPLIFSIIFVLIFVALCSLYAVFKSKFKSPGWKKLVLTGLLVSAFMAWTIIGDYRVRHREPAYFNQGVEQLRSNSLVKTHMDGFSSYTIPNSFPKNPGTQAVFHIGLISDSTTLYLTCTMDKIKEDWKLTNVVQDSIGKNR